LIVDYLVLRFLASAFAGQAAQNDGRVDCRVAPRNDGVFVVYKKKIKIFLIYDEFGFNKKNLVIGVK